MEKKINKTTKESISKNKIEKSISKNDVVSIINESINKNNALLLQQIQSLFVTQKESANLQAEDTIQEENNYKRSNIEYDSERLVSIQNMTLGAASYYDGRSTIQFTQPFAVKKIRWSKLKDFIDYMNNKTIFEDGNLAILDEEVRIAEGLQEVYEERGATEKDFKNMLKLKAEDLISKLHKLRNAVLENQLIRVNDLRVVFLNFFLKEYNKGNSDATLPEKFNKLDSYYKKEFNFVSISEIALTMKDGIEVWNL